MEQRAKPKRRKQNVNNEESASSAGPSGSSAPAPPPPSILPFAAPGGGFSVPAQPSTLHHPHPQAGLVGPRVPPTHFGPEAHDFMTTRNLNNVSFNSLPKESVSCPFCCFAVKTNVLEMCRLVVWHPCLQVS